MNLSDIAKVCGQPMPYLQAFVENLTEYVNAWGLEGCGMEDETRPKRHTNHTDRVLYSRIDQMIPSKISSEIKRSTLGEYRFPAWRCFAEFGSSSKTKWHLFLKVAGPRQKLFGRASVEGEELMFLSTLSKSVICFFFSSHFALKNHQGQHVSELIHRNYRHDF